MSSKTFNIVKLHFLTPIHISRGQTDAYDHSEEILHSDTIKSAIFVAARMLFGEAANEEFFDSFKVSSAFPFMKNDFFFPKPMIKLGFIFEDPDYGESKKSKKLKKLSYINNTLFERIINGEEVLINNGMFSEDGKFIFENDPQTVFCSELQQRLAMPSEDETDGTPYYIERIYFNYNSGFYFFIELPEDNEFNKKLEASIKLLGDEGIGTDKHVGNGIFKPEWDNLILNLPENAEHNMILSLYCPAENELSESYLHESSYQLIKRGGYIASPENIKFITFRQINVL